jgi:hypothetical protein
MSCGGSHLGFPIGIKNSNLVKDIPMIIPGQFGSKLLFFMPIGNPRWLPPQDID